MAWLYVQELAGSNSGSASPSGTDIELWVTSSGKPTQRLLSWRGWKIRPWIARLSGTISKPSTADRGAAWWISSLAATHASPSVSPVADAAQMIRDTCGPTFDALCQRYSQDSVSSRTSQTTLDWALKRSEPTYEEWVTGLKQDCLARLKWVRLTSASDCSSLPTATAHCAKADGPSQADRHTPGLQSAASTWPTPRASANENRTTRNAPSHGNGHGKTLAGEAAQWMTPNWPNGGRSVSAEVVAAKGATATGKRTVGLESQAKHWPTPMSADGYKLSAGKRKDSDLSHQVQEIKVHGPKSLAVTHGLPLLYRLLLSLPEWQPKLARMLNPNFVEWLMGWPIGWTAFEAVATEYTQSWRQKQHAVLLHVLKHETERPPNE